MTIHAKQNVAQPLVVAVTDNNGDYVTGLTVTYEVRKTSDNSLQDSGTLTGVGDIYTDNTTLSDVEDHYALYITPSGYENGEEEIIVNTVNIDDIQTGIDELLVKICKILGLSQSNYRLTDQVYNGEGCLLSATISIYENASDTENQVNPIAQYNIEATYSSGLISDYKVTEI